MDISSYLSLEFLLVIASVIFLLALPKILTAFARKSKVGFMISIGVVCVVIISLVVYFVSSYNYKYSLEGKKYVYGRITSVRASDTFIINSTKSSYKQEGAIGNVTVKINKDTEVYSKNFFENIDTVEVGDFVWVVCSDEEISNSQVNATRVVKNLVSKISQENIE